MSQVASITPEDRRICREVADFGVEVSPREVRTLREVGAIETYGSKSGGRGKVGKYMKGTAGIVAGIELAKRDETYKRKLYRAVLIAWVRGVEVRDEGLRWAYRRHFEFEDRFARNTLDGKRVEDDEPDFPFPPEFNKALARAHLGKSMRPVDLVALERHSGQRIRDVMQNSSTPDLLPVPEAGSNLGLAVQRSDGSWRVPELGSKLWEALAHRPQAVLARDAPREELDAAREPVRAMIRASGFEPSDLVVAGQVPGTLEKLRTWHGANWWRLPQFANRRLVT